MPRKNLVPPLQDEFGSFTWKEWFKNLWVEQYYTSGFYRDNGVPNSNLGDNGDYYFRQDAGVGTHIYFKTGGIWTAIV